MKSRKRRMDQKRYRLENKLKHKYQVITESREIVLPYPDFESVPVADRYYVGQLIKMGYNIQLRLF